MPQGRPKGEKRRDMHVRVSQELGQRLDKYIEQRFARDDMQLPLQSAVIRQALTDFLDREVKKVKGEGK